MAPQSSRFFWLVILCVLVGFAVWSSTTPVTASPMAGVLLSSGSPTHNQDFNTLANSGTTASIVPFGWGFAESGTSGNTTYGIGTGSLNTGNTYSYGDTSSTERAFGGLRSGTLIPLIGSEFTNGDGSATISSVLIEYTGEQWRLGAAGRSDQIDFQYSTNATSLTTGTWTDVDTLDFVSPNTTTSTGAKNGNAPENRTLLSTTITGLTIAPSTSLWIRWTDLDATGADDGLWMIL